MTETQRHEGKPEMSVITAQVSLYPPRQESIDPTIREAVRIFRQCRLRTRVGAMSSLVRMAMDAGEPTLGGLSGWH